MHRQKTLDELIIEDDASRHLESLSDEERLPNLVENKLGKSSPPLTDAEYVAVEEIFH